MTRIYKLLGTVTRYCFAARRCTLTAHLTIYEYVSLSVNDRVLLWSGQHEYTNTQVSALLAYNNALNFEEKGRLHGVKHKSRLLVL